MIDHQSTLNLSQLLEEIREAEKIVDKAIGHTDNGTRVNQVLHDVHCAIERIVDDRMMMDAVEKLGSGELSYDDFSVILDAAVERTKRRG